MSVILLGASPWGTRALTRLGVGYHLVVPPGEDLSPIHGTPLSVTHLPYVGEPESALAAPCPRGARAVVSFTEAGLLPAALLGARTGLAATSVTGVALTRNKLAMRRTLDGVVPQPRFGQVGVDEVPAGLDHVVVKPQSGTAGLGVSVVSTSGLAARDGGAELWEELVPGPELSIETVSRTTNERLDVELVGVTMKRTSGAPDFVELSHAAPARLSDGDHVAVAEVVRACLEQLEVTVGAAHTELVLTPDRGPVVIEVQTRPGGGRIPSLHELVSGVDHYEAAIRSLLELPRTPPRRVAGAAAARMILQPFVRERLPALPGLDQVNGHASATLVDVEIWRDPSETAAPTRSNLDRHGVAVAAGDDADAVHRLLDHAVTDLASHPLPTTEEISA